MTCYGWESGTIKLPTAEFTKVKKAVLDAAVTNDKALFDAAQRFWKMLPAAAKRNATTYRRWVRAFVDGNTPGGWNHDPKLPTMQPAIQDNTQYGHTADELDTLLSWTCCKSDKPRRALKTDMAGHTNRTTTFQCGDGATITFDRTASTVRWHVPENNHAVDRARDHPLAVVLFNTLDRVNWTRGSGGKISGNNEYNREPRDAGSGANYVVDEYGPKHNRRPQPTYALAGGFGRRW